MLTVGRVLCVGVMKTQQRDLSSQSRPYFCGDDITRHEGQPPFTWASQITTTFFAISGACMSALYALHKTICGLSTSDWQLFEYNVDALVGEH